MDPNVARAAFMSAQNQQRYWAENGFPMHVEHEMVTTGPVGAQPRSHPVRRYLGDLLVRAGQRVQGAAALPEAEEALAAGRSRS